MNEWPLAILYFTGNYNTIGEYTTRINLLIDSSFFSSSPIPNPYIIGSDHFNRSMRLWAKKNGFHLSDHEITRRYAEEMESEPIPVRTEEDIFKALGLEYKAPHEREV